MFQRPEIVDVVTLGEDLGFKLTSTEARILRSRLAGMIADFEALHELRIDEQSLPLTLTERDSGYRPGEDEDPLNAFIRKCHVAGSRDGPLSGKTIGLKDNISLAGVPLTFGSHFMDGYIPDFDATVVTRILAAGGTIVGKMNMEDFACGGSGYGGIGDYGRVLNPHNSAYASGGSSSGSAAAVAARNVDIAFGGDQGGSIRVPAAWCGVVGLMPTYGLVPHTGVFGSDPTVDVVGPMARTVEEVAIALECVAGGDGYDPRQANLPDVLPSYTEGLRNGVDGLRVGILSEGFGAEGSDPAVERSVMEAVGVLEQAGARLSEVSVPLHSQAPLALLPLYLEGFKHFYETNFGGAFTKTYYPTSLIVTFGRYRRSHARELPPNMKLFLIAGAYLGSVGHGRLYAKAQNLRPIFVKQYNAAFKYADVLAMPTVLLKPHVYHEPISDHEEALDRTLFGGRRGMDFRLLLHNTAPFNYTGHPAISIPCGKVDDLPVGLMLVAPFFREDQLLRAAHAHQESQDWANLSSEALPQTENN